MPPETPHTLTELSRLAGVTPRTIRYYIGQGLLPSPGSGPNARYGGGHLARLRLIRRLQRQHLPLAEIRRRLDALSDDALSALADAPDAADALAPSDSAVDYIRRLTARPPASTVLSPPPRPPSSASAPAQAARLAEHPAPGAPAIIAPPEPERSTWERHAVTPDVEIHVRRPLDRHTSKQVERLIRVARDLLADDV